MQIRITFVMQQQRKTKVMGNEKLKSKVAAKLLAAGNNPLDVEKMVDSHFDYAASNIIP